MASSVQPLIHRYVSILEGHVPATLATAVHELLHLQLGRVVLSQWIAAASSTEVGVAMGLAAELRRWLVDWEPAGGSAVSGVIVRQIHPPTPRVERQVDPQVAVYLCSAALDQQISEHRDREYQLKLARIRAWLGVSAAELARLLGVSREAVRQWELGAPVGEDRWPLVDRLFETSRRLTEYFKLEALPSVVRRRSQTLNNQSPMDWLFMQRHDELVAAYERLFTYAATE
jgi:DNA-binding XRE family transcriptional regulator